MKLLIQSFGKWTRCKCWKACRPSPEQTAFKMRSVIRWYRPLSAYTSLKWSRVAAILIRHHNIAPCQRLLNHDWLLYLSRRSIGRVADGSLPVTQNKIFKFKSVNGYDFSPYMPKISNRIAIIMRIQPRLRSSLTAIIYQFKVFYSGEEMLFEMEGERGSD